MKTVEKRIRGQKVTQREFRAEVVSTLRGFGPNGGSGSDIAALWGGSWPISENRALISKTLDNMFRRGLLTKVRHGKYVVNEEQVALGLARGETTERQIIQSLQSRGGFATMSEIATDFGVDGVRSPCPDDPDRLRLDPVYAALTTAISRSALIRKDFQPPIRKVAGGRAGIYYHLPRELLDLLPRTGFMTYALIKNSLGLGKETTDVEIAVEAAFAHLGATVDRLMEAKGVTPKALLQHPSIKPAMRAWHLRYPAERRMSDLAEFLGDAPEDKEAALQARLDFDEQADERILTKFLNGEKEAHLSAPFQFYVGLGAALNVSAMALSRGSIEPVYAASWEARTLSEDDE